MVPVWCVCLCAANKQSFSPVQARVSEKMSWEQCNIIIFIWDNSFSSWLYLGILSLFIPNIDFFGHYGRYLQKTRPTALNSFCSNSSATMIPWYIVLKPCAEGTCILIFTHMRFLEIFLFIFFYNYECLLKVLWKDKCIKFERYAYLQKVVYSFVILRRTYIKHQ